MASTAKNAHQPRTDEAAATDSDDLHVLLLRCRPEKPHHALLVEAASRDARRSRRRVTVRHCAATSPTSVVLRMNGRKMRLPIQPLDDLTPVFFVARAGSDPVFNAVSSFVEHVR